MPPAALPATDADGDSVSGSDREEVQEKRDDYEEALAEASEGSSSDQVSFRRPMHTSMLSAGVYPPHAAKTPSRERITWQMEV